MYTWWWNVGMGHIAESFCWVWFKSGNRFIILSNLICYVFFCHLSVINSCSILIYGIIFSLQQRQQRRGLTVIGRFSPVKYLLFVILIWGAIIVKFNLYFFVMQLCCILFFGVWLEWKSMLRFQHLRCCNWFDGKEILSSKSIWLESRHGRNWL